MGSHSTAATDCAVIASDVNDIQESAQQNQNACARKDILATYTFGGSVAESMNAFMEEGRDEANLYPQFNQNRQTPNVDEWREKLEAMDFDQRVQATLECLGRRTVYRDILYGLLEFCTIERTYEEIEPFVEEFTEYHRNRQSQRRYVQMLLRCGALEEIELDEVGEPLTQETKENALAAGLDPADIDTLVFDWRVRTTEVGEKVLEEFSPANRIATLFAADPERVEAFKAIMTFCETPQTADVIIESFRHSDLMGYDEKSKQIRQPAAYIEKLDRAGALAWDGDHWTLTEAGQASLD